MIKRRTSTALCAVLFALVSVLLSDPGDGARAGECLTVKEGAVREIGRFKSDGREQSYCVYARAGQTMKVTITPLAPDMPTQGHVVFPSGQQDGGSGGIVFDDKLSEEGRYEIHVGHRFERKPGAFELSVELK
jgi:hypothetical protein